MVTIENWPLASVIMPIRNEASSIERSLGAILAQDYPANSLQIIVADGMSTDGTRETLERFKTANPEIELVDNPGRFVSTGLNAALKHAKGEIIIRVDGHCEVALDYIQCCVNHLLADNVDGVGGYIQTIGETRLACAIAIAMSSPFGVGDSAFRTSAGKSLLADSVPFPAYTRAIIQRAGLYDEELIRNQDDEYNYRLRQLGAKILLASDVHSRYYSRNSLRSLWRQYYQYGYWKVRVLQKHPRQMRLRQFVPPAFVASLLGSGLLALFSPVGRLLLILILGAYGLSNLIASIWTGARKGWEYLPLLPVIFACLHLSYGLGFLVGLIKFANRWNDRQGKVPSWS